MTASKHILILVAVFQAIVKAELPLKETNELELDEPIQTAQQEPSDATVKTTSVCDATPSGSKLNVGSYNSPVQITSPNGKYTFILQSDCNLVLYDAGMPVWASRTYRSAGSCRLAIQSDNNIVIYQGSSVVWSPNVSNGGFTGSCLVIQNDRNAVLYNGITGYWATSTDKRLYLKSLGVAYGNAPANTLFEVNGGSSDINSGYGGEFSYVYPIWTDNIDEAATSLEVVIQGSTLAGYYDVAKGAGGQFRYIRQSHDSNALYPIVNVGLFRTGSPSTNVPYGHTIDINKGRGGSYLYVIFQKLGCLPDGYICTTTNCELCCNGSGYNLARGRTVCGPRPICLPEATNCGAPGLSCSNCCNGVYGGSICGAP